MDSYAEDSTRYDTTSADETIRLEKVLNEFAYDFFSGLFFCCPARVEGVQFVSESRIDVRPLNMPRTPDNVSQELPVIKNVPFMCPSSPDGGMVYSPKQGHTVLLMFPHCEIDPFKAGSVNPYETMTNRMLDINDAIAICGLNPFNLSVNHPVRHFTEHQVGDVSLFNNLGEAKENKVALHQDGSIDVTSSSNVTVDTPLTDFTGNLNVEGSANVEGNLVVGGDITVAGDVIIQGRSLIQFMNLHVHPYTDDGNPMETAPPVPL